MTSRILTLNRRTRGHLPRSLEKIYQTLKSMLSGNRHITKIRLEFHSDTP